MNTLSRGELILLTSEISVKRVMALSSANDSFIFKVYFIMACLDI